MKYPRILIIRTSSLGDIVMTLPCLPLLKQAYPESEIYWLLNKSYHLLLKGNNQLTGIIQFDRAKYSSFRYCWDFIRFSRNLKKQYFDLVIDFQGLFRSGFLAYSTAAPVRVGPKENREYSAMFYTHHADAPRDKYHSVDRHIKILAAVPGIQLPNKPDIKFPLPDYNSIEDKFYAKLIQSGWNKHQESILLTPGARRRSTNLWLTERYAELADRLLENHSYNVILIGDKADRNLGMEIESKMKQKPVNLIGKTGLDELIYLIRKSKLMIANDTGPMHLAVACELPVIAIFGPADPARTGPYGALHKVIQIPLPCSPCLLPTCPGYGHICMKEITTDMVYNQILSYIK